MVCPGLISIRSELEQNRKTTLLTLLGSLKAICSPKLCRAEYIQKWTQNAFFNFSYGPWCHNWVNPLPLLNLSISMGKWQDLSALYMTILDIIDKPLPEKGWARQGYITPRLRYNFSRCRNFILAPTMKNSVSRVTAFIRSRDLIC